MKVAAYVALGVAAVFAAFVIEGGLYVLPMLKVRLFIPSAWSLWAVGPFVLLAMLLLFGPASWHRETLATLSLAISAASLVLFSIDAVESGDGQAGLFAALLPLAIYCAVGVAAFAAALKGAATHEV